MQGEIIVDNKEYHFKFDITRFELTIYGLPGIVFTKKGEMAGDLIKPREILNAHSFDNKFPHVKFIVKGIETNYLDRIVIKILYYVKTRRDVDYFDAMSFSGDELNYFYDIKKAIDTKGFSEDGQLDIRVKKFEEVNKEFTLDECDPYKNMSLNFFRRVSMGKTEVLTVFTDMQLKFTEPQDYHEIYEHYYLIYNFLRFVTYRNNIEFKSIHLKVITSNGKYDNVGELRLFIDRDNFYVEKEKIQRDRQIKVDYLGEKIPLVVKLLKSKRLYMDHYPENSADMRHITPARFLLVTAAFEWECQEVYGDFKYEENEPFRIVTDLIYNILEEEKNKVRGKKKKYLNTYQKGFKYNGVSLAEKIQYALNDNKGVLSDFIENLYKLNGIEENEYSYNIIAERIGSQRNNYAHGQIDREMNYLVVLDFIVLEWLIYSMRLKQMQFEENSIKKMINELFGRNFYIE